jgi:hypothetical protein
MTGNEKDDEDVKTLGEALRAAEDRATGLSTRVEVAESALAASREREEGLARAVEGLICGGCGWRLSNPCTRKPCEACDPIKAALSVSWVGSDIRILVGEIRALRAQVDALAKEWEKEADSPGDSDSIRHTLGACAHSLRRLLRDPEPADAGGEST